MSAKTINDLTEIVAADVAAADLSPLWDASASTTKKIQAQNLLDALLRIMSGGVLIVSPAAGAAIGAGLLQLTSTDTGNVRFLSIARPATGFDFLSIAKGNAIDDLTMRIRNSAGNAIVEIGSIPATPRALTLALSSTVAWVSGATVDFPADASIGRVAPAVVGPFDGGVGAGWFQNTAGRARTTGQFDKTNATLANVTGLTVNVAAGRTYKFIASLPVTADAAGGYKVAMAGTCTATTIYYDVSVVTTGVAPALTRLSALAGTAAGSLGTTVRIWIEGVITVNAAGTLTTQFAQSTAVGTSSVLVGADMQVEDMP